MVSIIFFGTNLFAQSGTWDMNKAPMPVKTCGFATELVDVKIFLIGGWTATPEKPDSTFAYPGIQVYDPATDSWDTTRTHMPTPRYSMASAVVDKKVFLFGGSPYTNIVEVYDTETDTWDVSRTSMMYNSMACQSISIDSLIFVAGAWDTEEIIAERFAMYNTNTDEWTTLPSLHHPVGHMSIDTLGGLIYFAGGISIVSKGIKKIQVFDPVSLSWTVLDSELPDRYCAHGSFVRGNRIYYMAPGGDYHVSDETMVIIPEIAMLDTQSGCIWKISNLPFHKCYLGVIDLGNDIFTAGGFISDDSNLSAFENICSDVGFYSPAINPIYPGKVEIGKNYLSTDNDSIHIVSEMVCVEESNFTVLAKFSNIDGSRSDSIALFDDGMHGDELAEDGKFGGYIKVIEEYEGALSIKTLNTVNGEYFTCFDVEYFTSIGPIINAGARYFSTDTIPDPGDQISLRPNLQNLGTSATATDISARFFPLDEQIGFSDYTTVFVDLDPGSKVMGQKLMSLRISEECSSGDEYRIGIEIFSGANLFWRDTAVIRIGQGFVAGEEEFEYPESANLEMTLFPNPGSGLSVVSYQLLEFSPIEIDVLNLSGQKVMTLFSGEQGKGAYKLEWDTRDLPDGVYFVRLVGNQFGKTQKLILMK